MKKKSLFSILSLVLFLAFVSPMSSCKTGEGCPNEAAFGAPEDLGSKKAQKRGKSSLFSKKQKKKRKR